MQDLPSHPLPNTGNQFYAGPREGEQDVEVESDWGLLKDKILNQAENVYEVGNPLYDA